MVLLGDGCQGVRVGGYAHGIVFSAKELKADELFEVNKQLLDYSVSNKSATYLAFFCYKYCVCISRNKHFFNDMVYVFLSSLLLVFLSPCLCR